MVVGDILYGFQEGKIAFPPSYRRARGPDGDGWDYTDVSRLSTCYTTYLGSKEGSGRGGGGGRSSNDTSSLHDMEEGGVRGGGGKIRTPSYTARIM